jgi:hypothetical protein
MAIIFEDGSGVKGAQVYATEAFFRAYFLARNVDVTTWTQAQVEGILVSATDYIDTRWGLRFKGNRKWRYLYSRSVFTLTDQPANNETVTIGTAVATFKTTLSVPAVDTEAEIGNTLNETLNNLATALANADADLDEDDRTVVDFLIVDPDTPTLTCYVTRDGVATTETVTNGSFNAATSSGWSGRPQLLEFPRVDCYDDQGLIVRANPIKLQEATCEYAYRAKTAALAPDPTIDATGLRLRATKKKVGPIITETEYVDEQSVRITKPYPAADRLLQEYVTSSHDVIRA